MSKQITSNVLGVLTQDNRFSDWWKSNEIAIPFFGNEKRIVTYMDFEPEKDKAYLEEADRAIAHFLHLTLTDRNEISELALKNCYDFLEEVESDEADDELRAIKDKNEIWKFIHPSDIYVKRRPYGEQDMYVQVTCECDWEQEHGLQLVFRQGRKLSRISAQDGHLTEADAYDIPDAEDELLSKF